MQLVFLKKKYTMKHYIRWLMNMINIFVLFLSQIMISPVLADNDDEYLQINDFYTYSAYKFWSYYGFTPNITTSYTNTLNTISESTSTGTFTFAGTFTGSFDAYISLSFFGEIGDPGLGVAGIVESGTDHFYTVDTGNGITASITQTTAGSYQGHNTDDAFACTYHPQSTAATSTITCNYTGNAAADSFTIGELGIEVDELEFYSNTQSTYLVKLKNEGTETGSLSGSLSLSGNGQGTLNISESGTSTTTSINTNSLKFVLPTIKGNLNNDYSAYKLFSRSSNYFTIIVLRDINLNNLFYGKVGDRSGNIYDLKYTNQVTRRAGVYILDAISITNDESDLLYYLPPSSFTNREIIPLYIGGFNNIPDDLFRYVYGHDRTLDELTSLHNDMVTGNSGSQSATSDLSNQQQSFESATDDIVNLESDTFSGVSDAIGNVNVDNNILIGSGFLNAANWVRVQFDNLTSYPAFNSVLVFSLSLGFALLIIGKVR